MEVEFEERLRLYEQNQDLVKIVLSKVKHPNINRCIEDAEAVGLEELWECTDRFDDGQGAEFATFAFQSVRGAILRELNKSHIIHIPEYVSPEKRIDLTISYDNEDSFGENPLDYLAPVYFHYDDIPWDIMFREAPVGFKHGVHWFYMNAVEGYDPRDIAKIVRCKEDDVKKTIERVRTAFRNSERIQEWAECTEISTIEEKKESLFDKIDHEWVDGVLKKSPKAKEVFYRLLAGQHLKEIASDLGCSYSVIVDHNHIIHKKFNVHSKEELFGLVFKSVNPAIRPEMRTLLTPRQIEVLRWSFRGLEDKDVAKKMGITIRAVRQHRAWAYKIIGTTNRIEAMNAVFIVDSASVKSKKLPDLTKYRAKTNMFSRKVLDVFALYALEVPKKRIAQQFDISVRTVEFHVNTVYNKLDIHDRKEAFDALFEEIQEN